MLTILHSVRVLLHPPRLDGLSGGVMRYLFGHSSGQAQPETEASARAMQPLAVLGNALEMAQRPEDWRIGAAAKFCRQSWDFRAR